MDRFKGKTALITGGTTGIGLATAKLFINEGARVIVTGRTSATIKTAQAELGDNAIVIHSDATSLPDMDALAAEGQGDVRQARCAVRQRGIWSIYPI